ncbi:TPA: acyltransferase family protein [Citrobacter freundii]|nr:acyltransferase [Citrobacter freundii]HBM9444171.1 acyltransferase [Citrobacter freundii]
MNYKIQSIQALRGIAAMMVVLGHMNVYLNGAYSQSNLGDLLFFNGAIGVDIFFVISGFIIALATEKKETNTCVKFAIKRLFRIYPVYAVCFLLFSAVTTHMFFGDISSIPLWFNVENITSSLLFLPLRPEDSSPFYGYSLILTAWTLSYEVYFYAIFLFSMAVSHKYRATIASIAILLISYVLQTVYHGNFSFDAYAVAGIEHSKILTIAENPISIDFIMGLISFYMFKFLRDIEFGIKTKYICVSGLLFGVLCWNSGFQFGHGITKFGIIAFIIFISVVFGEMAFRFKISKSLITLGDLSYSIYISHVVVIFAYNEFGKSIPFIPQQHGFSLFIFMISAALLLSYILFKLIEQPSIKLSHAICKRL